MPFHDDFDPLYKVVVEPAVMSAGDKPIHLKRLGTPGDVKTQIDDGIKNCEYAIAVLDKLRSNVLYELGIAHGCDKTTILMNREGALRGRAVPFDLPLSRDSSTHGSTRR